MRERDDEMMKWRVYTMMNSENGDYNNSRSTSERMYRLDEDEVGKRVFDDPFGSNGGEELEFYHNPRRQRNKSARQSNPVLLH